MVVKDFNNFEYNNKPHRIYTSVKLACKSQQPANPTSLQCPTACNSRRPRIPSTLQFSILQFIFSIKRCCLSILNEFRLESHNAIHTCDYLQVKFDDTKGVTRSRKSVKGKQYHSQKKKRTKGQTIP